MPVKESQRLTGILERNCLLPCVFKFYVSNFSKKEQFLKLVQFFISYSSKSRYCEFFFISRPSVSQISFLFVMYWKAMTEVPRFLNIPFLKRCLTNNIFKLNDTRILFPGTVEK